MSSRPTALDPAPLLGCAVGDALGVAFETMPHDDPRLRDWRGAMLAGGAHAVPAGRAAGQYSDDTQLSVALGEALLAGGGRYAPA